MNKSDGVNKLKEECLELFKLKSDFEEYENRAIEIAGKVRDFRLEHTIHSDELCFLLVNPVKGKKLSDISYTEFRGSIEEYFRVKKTDFYFQISELSKFPPNYQLGYGVLLTFASLPKPIRIFAKELSKGKIAHEKPEMERVLKEIVRKIIIPSDPHIGYWLRIPTSTISYRKRLSQAFRFAEESLDILRIATPMTRIHLPQYAIGLNADESKAFLATASVEFNRCPYHPRKQELIDRLSDICVKPSSPLERRIKDALHFYRIGDNYSPDHQKIFFYVAAIEHMIISGHTDLTFKFSQKGAILLAETRDERLNRFNKLKKLYQKRSAIAHGEKTDYDFDMTTSAHHHVYHIIGRMLGLIESHGLQRVSPEEERTGDSLDEYIDNILYSGQTKHQSQSTAQSKKSAQYPL